MQPIAIEPASEEMRRLWVLALDLAEAFGGDRSWTLIGGLMVQLFSFEHDGDARATTDIDFLGDARRKPRMTSRAAEIVIERGGEVAMPPRTSPDLGYRFEIAGEIVEILGPEGLRSPAPTVDGLTTFSVDGGRQALERTEAISVSLDGGEPRALRRPRLLGAILIKARAVDRRRREKFRSDRLDLVRLLGYVEDPRSLAAVEAMSAKEKDWLGKVENLLDFESPDLSSILGSPAVDRARQAHALLLK